MARIAPVGLALVAGCALIPDSAADPARGAGTAAALLAAETGRAVANRAAAAPLASCRSYDLPDDGPVRVVTELVYVSKSPGAPSRRWWETRDWVRDLDGDVSSSSVLVHRLPDGRSSRRTREDRVVAGRSYAAIDGRFVDAGRVRAFDERVAEAPFSAVDDVLAYIAVGVDGRAGPAPPGEGLCDEPTELPPAHSVELLLGERTRQGWVRWQDDYTHIVVRFEESVRSVDRDVTEPAERWPIDPDDSYRAVEAFLAGAREDGWLGVSRVDHEVQGP